MGKKIVSILERVLQKVQLQCKSLRIKNFKWLAHLRCPKHWIPLSADSQKMVQEIIGTFVLPEREDGQPGTGRS